MTKRMLLVLLAALLICLPSFGCSRDAKPVNQMTEDTSTTETTINPWDDLPGFGDEETGVVEQTDPIEETDPARDDTTTTATAAKTTTTAKAATTRTNTPATTTRTTTRTTTTTRTATTAKAPTTASGSFNIASRDAALAAFNSGVAKVVNGRAGFAKSHLITRQGWNYDAALTNGLNIPLVGDAASYISGQLGSALGNGIRTASNQKGSASLLIKNSNFTMTDMRDVTYARSGNEWTVTLLVKGGETRRKKPNTGYTGTAPIAKGPLNHALGDGSVYDHMTADRIFSLIKDRLGLIQADPIDVSEATSNTKIVARLNTNGELKSFTVTYDQTINIREIRFLAGTTPFRNNTSSSAVTITFDAFLY